MRQARMWTMAIAMLLGVACSRDAQAPRVDESANRIDVVPADAAAPAGFAGKVAGAAVGSREAPAAMSPVPVPQVGSDSVRSGSMLIRTGYVAIRVDSLEPAMTAVRAIAARLGGVVGNVSVAGGDYQVRSATLELRIPSPRFDDAMGSMTPIGKVEQSSVNAQDVGEEYVDLGARVANSKRLEQRLITLLATRTGKLEDVLAVERELARVREEIERHEGRLRFLGSRVAMSTITVAVSEKEPLVAETPGKSVIGESFIRAWRNFVGLVAGVISSLGVVLPLGLIAWLALRFVRRRRPVRNGG